jgi:lauroyl/myristoyl acyltransferase
VLYWVTRFLTWLADRVPARPRMWTAGTLTELIYWLWVSKRRHTLANMAQVLGRPASDPQVRWTARRSWHSYGRYLAEFFNLPNTTVADILARTHDATPPPGWRLLLDEALAPGRGALVATAHFGNWDVAGVIAGTHMPLHVIAETFDDPRLNALVVRQRAALGMTIIPMERSLRRLVRVLQDGGTIATPVDRPLPAGEGVPITFFGRRCYVPGGVAQLALKTGAAIVVGFAWYDEAYSPAYHTYMASPIFPHPSGDRRADVIALTQRIYDVIAQVVSEHPTQWYMFRPFWPPDEPSSAASEQHPDAAVLSASGLLADGEALGKEGAQP